MFALLVGILNFAHAWILIAIFLAENFHCNIEDRGGRLGMETVHFNKYWFTSEAKFQGRYKIQKDHLTGRLRCILNTDTLSKTASD